MCLNILSPHPYRKKGYGYKVYYRYHGDLSKNYYSEYCQVDHILGGKYHDFETGMLRGLKDIHYETGFHIYRTLRGAEQDLRDCSVNRLKEYVIVRVKYDNAVASGLQWNRKCVVAKDIELLEVVAILKQNPKDRFKNVIERIQKKEE